MQLEVYTLNAFAKTPNGGNPAGVVLDSDGLTENQMQRIASAVGYSETAYVQKSSEADFKVRFFTPIDEVDLCGHATIATFYLLASEGIVDTGKYTQETKAGFLGIEVKENNTIFMDQKPPEFSEIVPKKKIAETLNISEDLFAADLPIQIVSTGLRDILIPIKSLDDLHKIKPDFDAVARVSKKYDVVGYHMFTLETLNNSTAHCRNLAPLYDIPEEAATGTSSGGLACYLFKYKKITNISTLVFEQGYSMNKPSEILARLDVEDQRITRVRVGGVANNIKTRVINI